MNNGGNLSSIISQLKADGQKENDTFIYSDLTNDSIPDFVVRNISGYFGGYHFYVCDNGTYKIDAKFDGDPYASDAKISMVKDLNADGLPEIAFEVTNVLIIFEWNGDTFAEILGIRDFGYWEFQIRDIDRNGTFEVVLTRGGPPQWNLIVEWPWREYTSIFSWNGSEYVRSPKVFAKPVYRFQTIQDADQFILEKDFDQALSLYQDAIFSNKLEWWSPERREYEIEYYFAIAESSSYGIPEPTQIPPTPPAEDTSEYPRLAAYACYRMVALHTYLGQIDAAQTKFDTMQQKFPQGSPGYPYVEMAVAFWDAYQSTQDMTSACAAAIDYAAKHPDILIPLGSDYHGAQSKIYKPADVCPFR